MITSIQSIPSLSETEIQEAVRSISATYGHTERDFQMASNTYNSTFFRGLPTEFVQRACRTLKDHFENYTNHYWNRQSATAVDA